MLDFEVECTNNLRSKLAEIEHNFVQKHHSEIKQVVNKYDKMISQEKIDISEHENLVNKALD
jgi:hypothetical protein